MSRWSSLIGVGGVSVPVNTDSMQQLSAEQDVYRGLQKSRGLLTDDVIRWPGSVWLFHRHHVVASWLSAAQWCCDNASQSRRSIGTRKLLCLASNANARNNSMPHTLTSAYNRHNCDNYQPRKASCPNRKQLWRLGFILVNKIHILYEKK